MVSDLVGFIRKRNAQLLDAMQAETEAILSETKTYHQNAVRNWKEKPKWILRSTRSKKQLGGTVETTGDMKQIWLWVDKGTGTHIPGGQEYPITPRRPGGRLIFQGGYQPKTKFKAKANVGAGVAVGDIVSKEIVWHPGIKGRKFSETWMEQTVRPNFKKRIVKSVQRT